MKINEETPVVNATSVTNEEAYETYKRLYETEGLDIAEEYLADTFEQTPEEVVKLVTEFLHELPKNSQEAEVKDN